jgi:hypothetical protein
MTYEMSPQSDAGEKFVSATDNMTDILRARAEQGDRDSAMNADTHAERRS